LTREAAARLRAVADYTELGSGIRIAIRDLEIRGAGNLLGDEQSGHVAAVGFELYVDMLQEAIALRRGEPPAEREVRVDLPASAYARADSGPRGAARVAPPRGRAAAADEGASARLRAECEARFGPVPPPVGALLRVQALRLKLRRAGAGQLAARGGRVVIA